MIRSRWSLRSAASAAAIAPLALSALAACSNDPPGKPAPSVTAAHDAPPVVPVEWLPAPAESDVAAAVAREVQRAKAERRTLIVYVGASWCEPCERFHRAAELGQLDASLSSARFLAFDLDRDRDALDRAGYSSKMIPLFVIPRDDGSASPLRMEGGIKGEGAAANLTSRLKMLLAQAPPRP